MTTRTGLNKSKEEKKSREHDEGSIYKYININRKEIRARP